MQEIVFCLNLQNTQHRPKIIHKSLIYYFLNNKVNKVLHRININ